MKIQKNEEIDILTGLPNFIKFFTDDFPSVYREFGTILLVKIKPLKKLNAHYGNSVGDKLFQAVGNYLINNVNQKKYRHEGNGFLVVYKEMDQGLAIKHRKELKEIIDSIINTEGIEFAYFYGLLMPYERPIKSVADYYQIFYEEYMRDHNLTDGIEFMHYIVEGLSFRVNDMISQYKNVRDYALYDEISELPNSKSAKLFFEDIDETLDEYAILFIDGDNLSRFNQVSYEHGNKAIKEIAEIIQYSIRKSDKLFRWLSGDEFVVVATDISNDKVSELAERIRVNIESHFSERDIPATVSIGVSMYPTNSLDVHSVLSTAEIANKEAKAKGKNRYVFYS